MAEAYPKAYSFFSDSFFVAFEPAELHAYLDKILTVEPPKDKEELSKYYEEKKRDEGLDLQVLPYILLRRSRMHALDLRRQLESIEDELRKLGPGGVRSQIAFRFDILIQVAVEHLLSESEMKDRLQREPEFRQRIYDTLYYPADMWEKQEALDASKDALIKHLWERTGLKETKDAGARDPAAPATNGVPKRFISGSDREFLHQRLTQMVNYLLAPRTLWEAVKDTLPEAVRTAIDVEALLEGPSKSDIEPLLEGASNA